MNQRGMGALQVILACLVVAGLAYVISQTLNDNLARNGGNKAVVREGSNAAAAEQAVDSANVAAGELNSRAKRLKCIVGSDGTQDCPPE